jgi:hypothetical protein
MAIEPRSSRKRMKPATKRESWPQDSSKNSPGSKSKRAAKPERTAENLGFKRCGGNG